MPELPEIETTCRGIKAYIKNEAVSRVIVRDGQLRWPVPNNLNALLQHYKVREIGRRAKYILIYFDHGCLIIHLGMSGSLRYISDNNPPSNHDHVDLVFESSNCLRLRDPRRFGSIHWTDGDPHTHKLLNNLGPEPLDKYFQGSYLYGISRGRKQTIKTFVMDSHVVVGIGNIYANEILFKSGIHPSKIASGIKLERYNKLTDSIKSILKQAITKGGATLRDFVNAEGKPGYFQQTLHVYQQEGMPCTRCGNLIKRYNLNQRSTYYCAVCQK